MLQHDYGRLQAELADALGLFAPPIAISFVDRGPDGVERYGARAPEPTPDGRTGAVPAGCVFWIKAAERTFATVAEDHGNCSVGCVTHGLKTLEEVANNADVAALCESGWVTPEAMQGITAVAENPGAIVYGPLGETPVDPSVVLLRLNGKQQMMLHDAWPEMRLEGKPQCHIIAIAKEQGEVALSVGCMLSRVRTGMSNNEVTCAIPGHLVPQVIERLHAARAADMAVAAYAADDARRFGNACPSWQPDHERVADVDVAGRRTIMHPVRQIGGA
jgi:uncharacterized protein (DUF169 family)